MGSSTIATALTYADAAVQQYITNTAATVAGAFSSVATTLVALYVALWGWAMIRGMIQEPVVDGFIRIIKVTAVFWIATAPALYASYVSDFLFTWPTELAAVVTGVPNATTASLFDDLLTKGTDLATQMLETGSITNLGAYVLALLFIIATVIVVGLTFAAVIAAKIALAVLLAIGPIFILSLMFGPSEKMFASWLSSTLSHGFTMVFAILFAVFTFKLLGASVDSALASATANEGIISLTQATPFMLYVVVTLFLLLQAASLAHSVTGGISIGSTAAAGWAYDKLKGAAMPGLRFGGRSAKTLGKAAGEQIVKQFKKAGFSRGDNGGRIAPAGAPLAIYRKITGGSRRRAA